MKKWVAAVLAILVVCLCMTSFAQTYEDLLPGSKGEEVKQMQTRLQELQYYFRTVDGDYGNLSKAAVAAFQKGNGMEETGEATAEVLEKLYSDHAIPASQAYSAEELGRRIIMEIPEHEVKVGKSLKATAQTEVLSEEAPAKTTYAWYSSDKAILKAGTDGTLTGVGAGKATVFCCAQDDERIFASAEVEVRMPAKSITLDQSRMQLLIGADENTAKGQLECTVGPEDAHDRSVTWSSSDEAIVTVDENGRLQALSMGKATITAVPGDNSLTKTAVCEVTVSRSVDVITLENQYEMLNMGKTLQLTAEVLPEEATDQTIIWTSSDPSVASVSKGVVTGKKGGLVTITAEAADGSGVKAVCDVQVISAVKTLSLSMKTAELVLGGDEAAARLKLECAVAPAHAYHQAVIWTSSDEKVASVDEDGNVQALADGKTTITATTTDPSSKASASCEITVGQAVKSVKLDQPKATVAKGKTVKLVPTVLPDAALNKAVVWSSSNEKIATVNANGVVSAKSVGHVVITCEAKDGSGISASSEVQVIQAVTSIKAKKSRLVIFEDKTGSVGMQVSPADATNKKLVWSSADKYIASVDENGKVTGNRPGSTTITAAAADGSGRKATYKVTVEPVVPVTLEKIGTGIYNFNLLGLTVKNHCKTKTVADFDFEAKLYAYNGDVIRSGNYSLGKDVTIAPGATRTIKRTLSGVGYASRFSFTITGVSFTDGSYYAIPLFEQETCSYWR